jgi:hypothetical protein
MPFGALRALRASSYRANPKQIIRQVNILHPRKPDDYLTSESFTNHVFSSVKSWPDYTFFPHFSILIFLMKGFKHCHNSMLN